MKGIIQFVTIIIATSISSRYKRRTIRCFLESLKPQSNMDQKALFVLRDCQKKPQSNIVHTADTSYVQKVSSLMEV